jgi:hypothetical protein
MMVRPAPVRRSHIGFNRVLLSRRMAHDLAAFAYALVRLNMRACRNLLQKYLYRLRTFFALERECARWFVAHFFRIGIDGQPPHRCQARNKYGAVLCKPMLKFNKNLKAW